MASEVNKAKRIRGVYRGSVTRAVNQVAEIIREEEIDNEYRNKLIALKNNIVDKLEKVKEMDEKLENLLIEEETDAFELELNEVLQYHEPFYELFVAIEQKLTIKDESVSRPVMSSRIRTRGSDYGSENEEISSIASSENPMRMMTSGIRLRGSDYGPENEENSRIASSANPMRRNVRLPMVNIEPFDGEPLNYPSFINSFEEIIDKNESLATVEKFYYLRGLLRGKAKTTIEGFTLTEENYKEALDLLKERFGDKKLLQANFISSLLNLEDVTDPNDTVALRVLHDKIEMNIRNLKSLQITTDKYGTMLVPCILKKLPEDIRLKVTESLIGDEDSWNFDEVLKIFNKQLTAREKCVFVGKSEKSGRNQRRMKPPNYTQTAATLITTDGKKLACIFCGQEHKAWNCSTVTDVKMRKKIVLDQKRCLNCLRKSHFAKNCTSKFSCFKCKEKHNTCLCEANREPSLTTTEESAEEPALTAIVGKTVNDEPVLLKTAIVSVTDIKGDNCCQGRVLFDDASSRTYITQNLFESLKIQPTSKRKIIIKGACATSTKKECNVVKLKVHTLDPQIQIVITASVLDEICHPIERQATKLARENYPHLEGIKFCDVPSDDDCSKSIDILIGGDFYYEFVTGTTRRRSVGRGPVAIWTKVGWVLGGPVTMTSKDENAIVSAVHVSTTDHSLVCVDRSPVTKFPVDKFPVNKIPEYDPLLKSAENFWSLDCLGIIEDDENSIYDTFREDLRFIKSEKRYEVGLPKKLDPVTAGLPDNFVASKKQLMSNLNSMKKKPEVLNEYHKIITSQSEQMIIEKCPSAPEEPGKLVHYLPHHAVVRESRKNTSSSWVRVVYNGSFKISKKFPSLNDCLLKGPSLNPLIIEILIRFRIHPVAFVCDIKKAFLQIMIREEDRDLLRFFWVDDPFSKDPKVLIYRFCRVLFGLTSSPFLLNGTLREHFKKYIDLNPMADVVISLLLSLFVDDFAGGGCDDDDVFNKYIKLVEILKDANFEVHKFFSNDTTVSEKIREISANNEEFGSNYNEISRDDTNATKISEDSGNSILKTEENLRDTKLGNSKKNVHDVLGVTWDFVNDTLIVNLGKIVENCSVITKRIVLRTIAKIYDPQGFCSPVTLKGKLIFQELCRRNINWDENLPDDLSKLWNLWTNDLISAKDFVISRCYEPRKILKSSLIGFCDGSTKAYATAVYLRNELEDGKVTAMLVGSKARVAPLEKSGIKNKYTVPRLELLGCVIVSKFMETIANSLEAIGFEILQKRFYTDSTISLCRIKGQEKEFLQWVQNRVTGIRIKTCIDDWYYVPTKLNASDLPSRGCSLSELKTSKMWIHGPEFIREKEIPKFDYNQSGSADMELKGSCLLTMEEEVGDKATGYLTKNYFKCLEDQPKLYEIIDVSKFSDLKKLICVTAYILRFTCRYKPAEENSDEKSDEISDKKIKKLGEISGRNFKENFADNLTTEELQKAKMYWIASEQRKYAKKDKENFTKTGNNLCFFLEDNVIRCKGRIKNADLPYNSKFPIFLPADSAFTALIIRNAHGEVYHQKVASTLTQIRAEYWIPKGRQVVKKVISNCALCRLYDANPYQPSSAPDLPSFRVKVVPPFQNTGTDHAGPLYIKDIYSSEKKTYKCYIALFSCCVTRMVHLEIQPDLESSSTIRAMRRTFARVGTPSLMISDNHKTFLSKEIRNFAHGKGIKWRNIIDLAPNWGGFYERMNTMIKAALRKTLKNAHLNYEELETILVEIEAVINSRPLAYLSNDEILEPLTPSHLMYGRRLKTHVTNNDIQQDDIPPSKRVQYVNKLLNQYWQRFSSEYLISLRERNLKKGPNPDVEIGQVVLIKQKSMPRNSWNLGRITRVIRSPDGVAKGAELRTEKGTLKRPLSLLCPIEMDSVDCKNVYDTNFHKIDESNPNDTDDLPQIVSNDDISASVENLSDGVTNSIEKVVSYDANTTRRRKAAVTGELKRRLVDSLQ